MNATDMTAPVTRGELQQELAPLHQRLSSLEQKHGEILARHTETLAKQDETLAKHTEMLAKQDETLARHTEMHERQDKNFGLWTGAFLARIEQSEKRQSMELTRQIKALKKELRVELGAEFARHAKAIQEDMRRQFAAFEDKYADLPARMRRVEKAVFPQRPR
jgi:DNA repair exonuclease SbcCD ATPase subunit